MPDVWQTQAVLLERVSSMCAVGGKGPVSTSASPYNSQGAPFILGKADSSRLDTAPGTAAWSLSCHTQGWCIPALGQRGAGPHPHIAGGAPPSHTRSCTGKQEVSRNGKQSHCHHGGASKHIFM